MRVEDALMNATIAEGLFDGSDESAAKVRPLLQVLISNPKAFWDELWAVTGDEELHRQITDLLRTGAICKHTSPAEVARLLGFSIMEANPLQGAHE